RWRSGFSTGLSSRQGFYSHPDYTRKWSHSEWLRAIPADILRWFLRGFPAWLSWAAFLVAAVLACGYAVPQSAGCSFPSTDGVFHECLSLVVAAFCVGAVICGDGSGGRFFGRCPALGWESGGRTLAGGPGCAAPAF